MLLCAKHHKGVDVDYLADHSESVLLEHEDRITDDRIRAVLDNDVAIWSLTAESPHNDIMRRPEDLVGFKRHLRRLFDRIKAVHGESAIINVFPTLPNAASVEVGRVRMPKAALPLRIYDQNRSVGGFVPTLKITS